MGTGFAARDRLESAVDPAGPREVLIADVAHLLVSESSPAAVLEAAADILEQVVPHDALHLYTADPTTAVLRRVLMRGAPSIDVPSVRYGEGVIGSAANSGEPRLVRAVSAPSRLRPTPGGSASPYALIVSPLMARGDLKGVLCLYRFGTGMTFTEDEFMSAARFSVLAALAIENADIRSKLESLAMTDHLTGLCNHRFFQERLLEEVSRANRSAAPVTLLLYDIDDFKEVNDSYGHLLGDQVLQRVAAAGRAICRIEDPVCRIGGEEFAVILPGQSGGPAQVLAERIRRSVLELSFPMETRVTVSVGLAEAPTNASSPRGLFACADLALRWAKSQGKNCVFTYRGSTLGPRGESANDYPLSGQWEILAEGMSTNRRRQA